MAKLTDAWHFCPAVDHNEGKYPEGYDMIPCICGPLDAALREVEATLRARIEKAEEVLTRIMSLESPTRESRQLARRYFEEVKVTVGD